MAAVKEKPSKQLRMNKNKKANASRIIPILWSYPSSSLLQSHRVLLSQDAITNKDHKCVPYHHIHNQALQRHRLCFRNSLECSKESHPIYFEQETQETKTLTTSTSWPTRKGSNKSPGMEAGWLLLSIHKSISGLKSSVSPSQTMLPTKP